MECFSASIKRDSLSCDRHIWGVKKQKQKIYQADAEIIYIGSVLTDD